MTFGEFIMFRVLKSARILMTAHNRQIREAAENDYARWWQCFVTVFFVVFALSATLTKADTFGSDPNTTFDIEFVTIGNPGNADDHLSERSWNPSKLRA